MPPRIGIVVGEESGDILGSELMKSLQQQLPDARFEGVGGPRMLALGFDSFFPQDRLAVMGLIEPLKRLPELLRIRRHLTRHFLENPPDVFIGIDSPDFNLTLEQSLRAGGIATAHYVSPSVWAWRQRRVHKIARSVDLMLTLLPFEARFYEQHGVPVKFVGHPLADKIPFQPDRGAARQQLGYADDDTLVAILPGSRGGEVKILGPVFLETAGWCLQRRPDLKFVIAAANAARREQIELQLASHGRELPVRVVEGQSHPVLAASDLVLMASGTSSLEAMLFKRPMVVAYRFSTLTYWILRMLVKSRFFALPNLLASEPLVAEMLQSEVTAEKLGAELMGLLDDPHRIRELEARFAQLHECIRRNASREAARAILQLMGREVD